MLRFFDEKRAVARVEERMEVGLPRKRQCFAVLLDEFDHRRRKPDQVAALDGGANLVRKSYVVFLGLRADALEKGGGEAERDQFEVFGSGLRHVLSRCILAF